MPNPPGRPPSFFSESVGKARGAAALTLVLAAVGGGIAVGAPTPRLSLVANGGGRHSSQSVAALAPWGVGGGSASSYPSASIFTVSIGGGGSRGIVVQSSEWSVPPPEAVKFYEPVAAWKNGDPSQVELIIANNDIVVA